MDCPRIINPHLSKPPGGMHRGNGADAACLLMGRDARIDVYGRKTVTIGKQEGFVLPDIPLDALDSEGGHRVCARIHQRYGPVLLPVTIMELDLCLPAQRQRDIARAPKVIAEILLDHLPFVAQAKDKFLVPEMRIILHDVPQYRLASDWHHRFGSKFGLFPQPGAPPAA